MFTDFTWKVDAACVPEKLLSMYKTHSVKIRKFTTEDMISFKKRYVSLHEITLQVITLIG